jgi:hypothetical protein
VQDFYDKNISVFALIVMQCHYVKTEIFLTNYYITLRLAHPAFILPNLEFQKNIQCD